MPNIALLKIRQLVCKLPQALTILLKLLNLSILSSQMFPKYPIYMPLSQSTIIQTENRALNLTSTPYKY